MKREIFITSDGSTTIHLPDWNEQYHSKHGAIQEALHVFIKNGLHHFLETKQQKESSISILEIGFGTALNAFITFLESQKITNKIEYTGVEAYPVLIEEVEKLNYITALEASSFSKEFVLMHTSPWEEEVKISDKFLLKKRKQFFEDIADKNKFNLIYFDAFGARNQPELWTAIIFEKMYLSLKENGVLVTYAAKGSVRRALQSVGFTVERLPGPPGKREMLRACKNI